MSRTTTLSPAALTRGQKVSLSTSVTCPTAGTAVSKLDLAATARPPGPEAPRDPPEDRRWGKDRFSEEGDGVQDEDDDGDRIEGAEKAIRSAISNRKCRRLRSEAERNAE
ncbi:hypothetical protein BHE74_00009955 [Ensete ventricosum]|uniref:Uncharacterized protein n=1 Tax=Ensete ventricosum TaxID=4639 RepID=A0A444GAE9_ENSVE|nr:hypothetical protein B296_00056368 [Ensete ventricosum]RWW31847.1 hypothetical protein GW17_00003515 [Ensete ventricosum]RWW81634.1 hypothetical protein BHE74_00009955 [Ensete ventricosum]RZR92763.1 hypothetical protein BHM03_00021127 [Ensete ventricosum]